jgi:hypothetical protein
MVRNMNHDSCVLWLKNMLMTRIAIAKMYSERNRFRYWCCESCNRRDNVLD